MRISDWSSDVCSSDLLTDMVFNGVFGRHPELRVVSVEHEGGWLRHWLARMDWHYRYNLSLTETRLKDSALPSDFVAQSVYVSFSDDQVLVADRDAIGVDHLQIGRAHVELQSLMRISYAVFCLKKKTKTNTSRQTTQTYPKYSAHIA